MKLLPLVLMMVIAPVAATDVISPPSKHLTPSGARSPLALSIEYAAMPDYEQLFREIDLAKEDKKALKLSLLAFYSTLMPALRYEAFALEVPEALVAYSSAEVPSYELVKLHLLDPGSVNQDEYAFYERIVISDSYATAQELVLNILPTIPTEKTELYNDVTQSTQEATEHAVH